jgi:hypothetical protein
MGDELNKALNAVVKSLQPELQTKVERLESENKRLEKSLEEARVLINERTGERVDLGEADELFGVIYGELDKRLMPPGMEWPPKDSEGEDLSIGDKANFFRTEHDGDHEWHDVVTAFRHQDIEGEGDVWIVEGEHGEAFACECTKLTEPEVLGADGEPIKAGETVYHEVAGSKYTVEKIIDGELFFNGVPPFACNPNAYTHTPPETQERIDDDKCTPFFSYWGCNGISCEHCPAKIEREK